MIDHWSVVKYCLTWLCLMPLNKFVEIVLCFLMDKVFLEDKELSKFWVVITPGYFIQKWSNPNRLGGYLSPLSPWNEENAWKVRLCAKEETRNGCEKLSEKFRPKHKKFRMGRNMWKKARNHIRIFSPGAKWVAHEAKSQWLCV
jgi:hypothetical protein